MYVVLSIHKIFLELGEIQTLRSVTISKSLFCCCLDCLPFVHGVSFFLFLPCLFWLGFFHSLQWSEDGSCSQAPFPTLERSNLPTHFQLQTIGLLHGTTFLITIEKCYQHWLCQSKYGVFILFCFHIPAFLGKVHLIWQGGDEDIETRSLKF